MSVHCLIRRRVLVVEDEYIAAMETAEWLRGVGATVLGPVPTVDEALALIERNTPEAAVLDVKLREGQTSFPVADRLAALGVPFIFATAGGSMPESYRSRPGVQKPVAECKLLSVLQELLTTAPGMTAQ